MEANVARASLKGLIDGRHWPEAIRQQPRPATNVGAEGCKKAKRCREKVLKVGYGRGTAWLENFSPRKALNVQTASIFVRYYQLLPQYAGFR
ncbi:MAG: hypothetical protein KF734_10720 [Saprospiraceae bacterium]|nr:hypothetical protein [Saprospiraceae bacterium]